MSFLKDWLFGTDDDEDNDDSDPYIDPIIEERKKDKAVKPYIYEEPKEKKVESEPKPQPAASAPKTSTTNVKATTTQMKKPAAKPKPVKPVEKKAEKKETYVMTQIISPMTGVSYPEEEAPVVKKKQSRRKKFKMNQDELIPVISPMFGPEDEEEEKAEEPKETKNTTAKKAAAKKPEEKTKKKAAPSKRREPVKAEKRPQKPDEVINSVEDRLKNIANLTEETQDDLKIIEERTGKFKLDFKKDDDSLIDEIDDNMSLDELMNLYEKKFKE